MTRPALPVVLTRRAAGQVEDAARWWSQNRQAAPGAIREELSRALDLVALQPSCGVPARSAQLKGVRRIYLSRIDHFVYYRLVPQRDRIEVLAFWHARRGSKPRL